VLKSALNRTERFSRAVKAFRTGENVVKALRTGNVDEEIIEFAYDLQAGSYVAALSDGKMCELKALSGQRIREILHNLGAKSVCEAGTGEATTLGFIEDPSIAFSGFDISLSRLLVAQSFLAEKRHPAKLFCAGLTEIPLRDNAVDVVLTCHTIEPNGGNESVILRELYRVAARYLLVIEPDFERGSDEQKERMTYHGYVRGLRNHLAALPGKVVTDEPWPFVMNELNKASLLVFEKGERASDSDFVAPASKLELILRGNFFICPAEGCLYPIVQDVPVLRSSAAIICSRAADLLR
jgi:uncharacterized protein YbaR (Trm112 family)